MLLNCFQQLYRVHQWLMFRGKLYLADSERKRTFHVFHYGHSTDASVSQSVQVVHWEWLVFFCEEFMSCLKKKQWTCMKLTLLREYSCSLPCDVPYLFHWNELTVKWSVPCECWGRRGQGSFNFGSALQASTITRRCGLRLLTTDLRPWFSCEDRKPEDWIFCSK